MSTPGLLFFLPEGSFSSCFLLPALLLLLSAACSAWEIFPSPGYSDLLPSPAWLSPQCLSGPEGLGLLLTSLLTPHPPYERPRGQGVCQACHCLRLHVQSRCVAFSRCFIMPAAWSTICIYKMNGNSWFLLGFQLCFDAQDGVLYSRKNKSWWFCLNLWASLGLEWGTPFQCRSHGAHPPQLLAGCSHLPGHRARWCLVPACHGTGRGSAWSPPVMAQG